MAEEINPDNNCIIKAFENNPISILKDDNKKILFKALDIGKAIGIKNIAQNIQNYDRDEKVLCKAYDLRGCEQDTTFLTSQGVYRLLYNSKKEIAKKFRKWAGNILDDIIFNESAELKKQLENQQKKFIQDKQEILLTSYDKKCIVYIIKINANLYKFGNTDNIKRRFKEHYKEISQDIELVYCIESKNNTLLENKLKEYLKTTTFRKEQIINNKNQTEIIQTNDISSITNTLEIYNKNIYEDKEQLIIKRLELENENLKLQSNVIKSSLESEIKPEIKPEILEKIKKIEESKEKLDLKKQEYYEQKIEESKEKLDLKKQEYYEQKIINKEEYSENNKENVLEKERLRCQLYYYNNKEKERLRCQVYYYNNKEKERLRKQEYYKNNREKILKKQKSYSEKTS